MYNIFETISSSRIYGEWENKDKPGIIGTEQHISQQYTVFCWKTRKQYK